VTCCALIDAILAGQAPAIPAQSGVKGLRLALPANIVRDGMDAATQTAFENAIAKLSDAGAQIIVTRFPVLDAIGIANRLGGFAASEAYAWHRALLAEKGAFYDPRIRVRIERGAQQSAADYLDLLSARKRLIADMNAATAPYDALIMPTVPTAPPAIAALDDEAEYNRVNMLLLRNSALWNFLDRCAISLPCHPKGAPPAGLMLVGETLGDQPLFTVAAAVEALVQAP